jgi:hypothetical protein
MRRRSGLTAAAVLALPLLVQPVWGQRPDPEPPIFGHTLHQGGGYIVVPSANVARSSLFVTGTAISPEGYLGDDYLVTRLAGGITLAKFLEVGGTIGAVKRFSVFGKLQLVRQRGAFPSLAVGVHQLTTANLGRYGIEDEFYDDIFEASSIYGVFTYVVGPGRGDILSWVTISGGWGTGTFFEDNPQIEGENRSSGVFGAVSFDFQASDNAFLRFAGEWDGFDLNVGATAWLSGLEFTLGVLSLGKGDAPEELQPFEPFDPTRSWPGHFYNQIKLFVSVTVDFRALGVIPWVWTTEEEQ